MRSFLVTTIVVLAAALCACDTVSLEDEPVDVPFSEMAVASDLFSAPRGEYVIRDSIEWSEAAESWWDVVLRCDAEDECYEEPPPQFSFAASLIIMVAYGTIACSQAGGGIERITVAADTAFVELEPLEPLEPACLAAIHLNHFVRVAHSGPACRRTDRLRQLTIGQTLRNEMRSFSSSCGKESSRKRGARGRLRPTQPPGVSAFQRMRSRRRCSSSSSG